MTVKLNRKNISLTFDIFNSFHEALDSDGSTPIQEGLRDKEGEETWGTYENWQIGLKAYENYLYLIGFDRDNSSVSELKEGLTDLTDNFNEDFYSKIEYLFSAFMSSEIKHNKTGTFKDASSKELHSTATFCQIFDDWSMINQLYAVNTMFKDNDNPFLDVYFYFIAVMMAIEPSKNEYELHGTKIEDSSYLLRANELLLGINELAALKKAKKSSASNSAKKRHAENYSMKEQARDYFLEHRVRLSTGTLASAGREIIKIVPIKERTAIDWVGDFKAELKE
jgi:hypothetical protein